MIDRYNRISSTALIGFPGPTLSLQTLPQGKKGKKKGVGVKSLLDGTRGRSLYYSLRLDSVLRRMDCIDSHTRSIVHLQTL